MALLPCPECRRQISDQAEACPQCGYPMRQGAPDRASGTSAADDELRRMVAGNPGRKIEAIQRCRELYPGMGLADAKQHVERLLGAEGPAPRSGRSGCVGVLGLGLALTFGALLLGCATILRQPWRSIHDGATLQGWSAPDLSYWRVEDGAITGETTREHNPPRNQFIVWQGGEVRDFELKFEFRLFGEQSNSGMQFRGAVKEFGLVHGYQADMDGQGKFLGGIWDEYGPRQSLAGRGERVVIDESGKRSPTRFAPAENLTKGFKLGQWNEYHLTAVGPKISLRINGELVSELEDRETGRSAAAGVLAMPIIPGEPMKVQYRNLRLRER